MNNVLRMLDLQGKVDERQPLIRERVAQLKRAAEYPDATAVDLHDYAWELMNCETVELRDHTAALPVARRAVELNGGQDPTMLETLAQAYRLNGDLEQAIASQRKAVAKSRLGGPYNRADLKARLTNYLMESGNLVAAAEVSWEKLASQLTRTLLSGEPPGASLVVQADDLMAQERFLEAAAVLRGCLAIRQKELPEGHWLIADTQGRIGAALVADRKFSEAEPILVESYTQLNEDRQVRSQYKKLAIERIIRLYEAWDKSEQASIWRQRLSDVAPDENRNDNDQATTVTEARRFVAGGVAAAKRTIFADR